MKKVTVSASANSGVHIQDVFPAEGTFTRDIPAGTTKSFFLTDGQYNHIRAQLDAMLSAGLLTTVLVNESEEGRTDKFVELKKVASTMTVRTGFGDYFVGLDGKPYFKTDGGVVYLLGVPAGSDPITVIGTINAAGDFPLVGVAKAGWVYLINAPVTDPVTSMSFLKDDEIMWTGTTWELVGFSRKQKTLVVGDSPYAVTDADDMIFVDSSTGAITVNLPAAAVRANKRFEIMDVGNNASVNNITVQVAGVPFFTMDENRQFCAWESNGTAWQEVSNQSALALDQAHRSGNGEDHATVAAARLGNQIFEDFQLVAATATTRLFRARVAGSVQRIAAETAVAAAVGESMTVDIHVNGGSVLTAPILLDSTVPPATPVAGVVAAAPGNAYAAGDLIEIVRTYVAGGGPTPMASTSVNPLIRHE